TKRFQALRIVRLHWQESHRLLAKYPKRPGQWRPLFKRNEDRTDSSVRGDPLLRCMAVSNPIEVISEPGEYRATNGYRHEESPQRKAKPAARRRPSRDPQTVTRGQYDQHSRTEDAHPLSRLRVSGERAKIRVVFTDEEVIRIDSQIGDD